MCVFQRIRLLWTGLKDHEMSENSPDVLQQRMLGHKDVTLGGCATGLSVWKWWTAANVFLLLFFKVLFNICVYCSSVNIFYNHFLQKHFLKKGTEGICKVNWWLRTFSLPMFEVPFLFLGPFIVCDEIVIFFFFLENNML